MPTNFLTPTRAIAIAGTMLAAATTTHAFPAVDLRADGLAHPIAASPAPRFTWRVESEAHGQSQSAWHILVSTSAEKLAAREGDLWDSGKIDVAREPHVRYTGEPLAPGGTYHWAVRVWDAAENDRGWSEPATFEVAPTTPPNGTAPSGSTTAKTSRNATRTSTRTIPPR